MRYVALLRGINVGGNNIIKMAALRACFEELGLAEVATYIQSGNVLFEAGRTGSAPLRARIERALSTRFGYRASVVLRSRAQLRDVVDRAPDGFGAQPARFRYDVLFLKAPLTAATALASVATRPGVDEVHAGTGVLYSSRLIREASRSLLGRLVSQPIYQQLTIRNWNTTTRLAQLLEGAEDPAR